jgi:hypothetical protein
MTLLLGESYGQPGKRDQGDHAKIHSQGGPPVRRFESTGPARLEPGSVNGTRKGPFHGHRATHLEAHGPVKRVALGGRRRPANAKPPTMFPSRPALPRC